jgi:hypothetical protein
MSTSTAPLSPVTGAAFPGADAAAGTAPPADAPPGTVADAGGSPNDTAVASSDACSGGDVRPEGDAGCRGDPDPTLSLPVRLALLSPSLPLPSSPLPSWHR